MLKKRWTSKAGTPLEWPAGGDTIYGGNGSDTIYGGQRGAGAGSRGAVALGG
jgi:hypothetical protein